MMATATLTQLEPYAAEEPANPLATALLILATAVMFWSPASVFPALEPIPIFLVLFALCLLACFPSLLMQFTPGALAQSPTTVCLLLLLPLVPLYHLAHGDLENAWVWGFDYGRSFLYYLVVTALLSRPDQMRQFLFWLIVIIAVVVAIGVVDYYGIVKIPGIRQFHQNAFDETTGERSIHLVRMRSINFFHDPGALGMLIGTGMVLSLFFLTGQRMLITRFFSLIVLAFLGWSFIPTQSKVGFVTIAVALAAILMSRFGRRGTILVMIVLPVVAVVFAGRATHISVNDESAQDRIDLWSRGIPYFRQHPLFGIGAGNFKEEFGQQAHNSFWEPYIEMGATGGTLFLGAFSFAALGLFRVRHALGRLSNPEMRHFWPYLVGILVGNAVGMHTQPREFVICTYTILGMATAYLRMASFEGIVPVRWSYRSVLGLCVFSVLYVIATYIFIRLSDG